MNVAGMITMKDLENYFLKIIDGLINPATTRETLYSIVDSIVINCKEEVFIDVEIRENIKKTIGYILDLIGKRDPRIQSISRTVKPHSCSRYQGIPCQRREYSLETWS
jgi:hypothetical protein